MLHLVPLKSRYRIQSLTIALSVERKALPARRGTGLSSWRCFALGYCPCLRRGFGPLLTRAARIQEEAVAASDPNATISVRALPFAANQRANPDRFAPDGVERIQAGQLGVKCGLGALVEEL
jgi:hypothetical protein